MTREKKRRLEAIGGLIAEERSITSQRELVELLAAMGIKAYLKRGSGNL
jgi:arginine repressor